MKCGADQSRLESTQDERQLKARVHLSMVSVMNREMLFNALSDGKFMRTFAQYRKPLRNRLIAPIVSI